MTGTIEKTNTDGSFNLISTPRDWLLEDASTGKIIKRTSAYLEKNRWVKQYKLYRNVSQFWFKDDSEIPPYSYEIKSSRVFDDTEFQILFDNIIGANDEMFFDWYTDRYGELPWDNLKSIPKERIIEYVNENPDVLKDMEYEISISKDDYAAGNILDKNINAFLKNSRSVKSSVDDKLEYYISSDSFVERHGFDEYCMDKLIDMGFTNEQVEFEWDSPEIQKAVKKIEKDFDRDMDDYYKWAAKLIENDKFEKQEYEYWKRQNIVSSLDKHYHYHSAVDNSGKRWMESIVTEFFDILRSHVKNIGELSFTFRTWGDGGSGDLITALYEDGYNFATIFYHTSYYDSAPHTLKVILANSKPGLVTGSRYFEDLREMDVSELPWKIYSLYDSYLYEMRRDHENYLHVKNGGKVQNGIPVYPIDSSTQINSFTEENE